MNIELTRLNPLEQQIYATLTDYAKEHGAFRITDAADVCNCSSSKISKFVKKLGFDNFKQFMEFTLGNEPTQKTYSGELERIRLFTEEFDYSIVQKMVTEIRSHQKIILLGFGPSFYCAQYLEYKLRILCNTKTVVAVLDLLSAEALLDENSLLVIFSTTGHFTSFSDICQKAREKDSNTLLIIEEYSADLVNQYAKENLCFLTTHVQRQDLKPYEKSRVATLIFIEEVIFRLMEDNT